VVSRGGNVGRKLLVAVGVATLVGACVLPQPAYGITSTLPQVDGGSCDTLLSDGGDPTKDSENSCFVDGGQP
jgi:hypothetical protein